MSSLHVGLNEKDPGAYIATKDLEGSQSPASSIAQPKRTPDGKVILIPQPSDSSDDPLNWSWLKKNTVFVALLPGCFLTDGVLTYGSTLFVPQAMEWKMTPPAVSNSLSGGVFMQGPGGLLAVPLCQRFGRLPVLFWSQVLTLVMTIAANLAPTYAGYTACRTLQGFFGAPPQIIGLSIIHDIFFWHERARKINVWAFCFLVGPYLLPLISALVVEKESWRNTFAVLCGFYGLSVVTIIGFGDETLYNREAPAFRRSGVLGKLERLTGITGFKETSGRPTTWKASKDLISAIARPYLLLPTFGFVMFSTMWSIGIVNTVALFVLPPPYAFSQTGFALLFLAPLIGTLLAEVWGYWFNDFLARRAIARDNGVHKPEHRLWGVYPSWAISIAGLVLFGQAFQHTLPWLAVAFGWGMAAFGVLGTTTPVSTYVLDVFPLQAAGASAWILMARVAGGFSVTYFQAKWVAHDGPAVTWGTQAGILGAAIVSIVVLQTFGERMRRWWPVPEAREV